MRKLFGVQRQADFEICIILDMYLYQFHLKYDFDLKAVMVPIQNYAYLYNIETYIQSY